MFVGRPSAKQIALIAGLPVLLVLVLIKITGVRLVVYNQTGFDLDSVSIAGSYVGSMKKGESVTLRFKELSVQDGEPVVLPKGRIKNLELDTNPVGKCGMGIEDVHWGKFESDIVMDERPHGNRLFLRNHGSGPTPLSQTYTEIDSPFFVGPGPYTQGLVGLYEFSWDNQPIERLRWVKRAGHTDKFIVVETVEGYYFIDRKKDSLPDDLILNLHTNDYFLKWVDSLGTKDFQFDYPRQK